MKTPISSKLAIFAAALMMNGLIIAGVNYLFKAPMRQHTGEIALAHANGDSAVADQDTGSRNGRSGRSASHWKMGRSM
jgi:hypothetical protein